jgi:hypothetical protein
MNLSFPKGFYLPSPTDDTIFSTAPKSGIPNVQESANHGFF